MPTKKRERENTNSFDMNILLQSISNLGLTSSNEHKDLLTPSIEVNDSAITILESLSAIVTNLADRWTDPNTELEVKDMIVTETQTLLTAHNNFSDALREYQNKNPADITAFAQAGKDLENVIKERLTKEPYFYSTIYSVTPTREESGAASRQRRNDPSVAPTNHTQAGTSAQHAALAPAAPATTPVIDRPPPSRAEPQSNEDSRQQLRPSITPSTGSDRSNQGRG